MSEPQLRSPADVYQQYFVPAMFAPWSAVLLRHAALRQGERVLDVACGTGVVARAAASRIGAVGRVVALDMNPGMLGVARSLPAPPGAVIHWQEGDAQALPFGDGEFDAALCQHGLQFFPDRTCAVREMHRVLAPGGRAVVMVLQALERHAVFEALMHAVARQLSLPVSAVMIPFALSDAGELRRLFAAGGFTQVDVAADSIVARFPDPQRFVPLAVMSSAAAVPAFARLEAAERATLLEAVRAECQGVVQQYSDGSSVRFPMHAHVVLAVR